MQSLFSISEFRNYFIFFLVFVSISFYYFIHIDRTQKNPILQNENFTLKFILFLLIGFLFKQIVSISNTPSSLYFVGYLFVILLLIYIFNILIDSLWKTEKKKEDSSFQNEIYKTIVVLIVAFTISILSLYILPSILPNLQTVVSSFESVMKSNLYYYIGFFILFFTYRLMYGMMYSSNMKSSLFVPALLGIPTLSCIFLFIVYLGSQLKMIHWKNYLTTFVVLSILFSLFFYVWLYIFMDSVSSICKSKSKEEVKRDKSWIGKYLSSLLLISIFGMLWIVDSKKWNRFECIFYLIVTILLFTSFSTISLNYPNSSLLSFWLFIEWALVTYSNWLNVKNSFHCIFAND